MSTEANTIQSTSTAAISQSSETSSTTGAPIVSGVRAVVFAAVALGVGCGVASWVARGKYERFTGNLKARMHSVTCDRDVRLSQILTPQGKAVVSGAPLLKLEDAQLQTRTQKQKQLVQDLTDKVTETEAKVQLAVERERNSIKRDILDMRLLAAQLEGQRFEKDLEEVAHDPYGETFKSVSIVEANGVENVLERLPKPLVMSDDQFSDEKVKNKLRKQKLENFKETLAARIEMCNLHLADLKKKSNELPEQVRRSMGLNRVQAELENAKTELASLEQQQQSLTINAPGTGIVGVYRKSVGSHIAAYEEIVQVLDEDQPHVLLQVPSNRVNDFAAGTIVELQFPGGKSAEGKVAEVPPQTVNAPGLATGETQIAVQIVPSGLIWPKLPIDTMVEIRRSR